MSLAPLVLEHVIVGVLAFASTNVDDILLLAVFFGHPQRHVRSIVSGQFLGIGALVALSATAALAAFVVPTRWLALLGVVPLAMGLHGLWQLRQSAARSDATEATGALGATTWAVASVTIANGSDNVATYVPLFAAHPDALPIYVAVFAIGTAVWCALGRALVKLPLLRPVIERYAHRILPWAFLGIGGYVLAGWWR